MAEWARVPDDELDQARADKAAGKVELRWKDGWWARPIELGVQRNSQPVQPVRDPMRPSATIEDIRKAPPIVKTESGTYTHQYQECDCGEQYLVKSEHERTSPRHKKWMRGDIEVEVPPQPLMSAFPPGPTPRLELGRVVICGRCKAKDKKGEDYFPDRDSPPHNRFPCRRCNGHGVLPNVGPQ